MEYEKITEILEIKIGEFRKQTGLDHQKLASEDHIRQ